MSKEETPKENTHVKIKGKVYEYVASRVQKFRTQKEFKGYGDFGGTGNIAAKDTVFRSFEEAKKYARSLKLKEVLIKHRLLKTAKPLRLEGHSPQLVWRVVNTHRLMKWNKLFTSKKTR